MYVRIGKFNNIPLYLNIKTPLQFNTYIEICTFSLTDRFSFKKSEK